MLSTKKAIAAGIMLWATFAAYAWNDAAADTRLAGAAAAGLVELGVYANQDPFLARPKRPLQALRSGESVILIADWAGGEAAEQLVRCEMRTVEGRVLSSSIFRYQFSGESDWTWCRLTAASDVLTDRVQFTISRSGFDSTEGSPLLGSLELALETPLWRRLLVQAQRWTGVERSAPYVFDSSGANLMAQEFYASFDQEAQQPTRRIKRSTPGQRFYYQTHWAALNAGRSYAVQCRVYAPDGQLYAVSEFESEVTEAQWNFWCSHEVGAFEQPGNWRFQMQIGEELYAEQSLELQDSLNLMLMRWLVGLLSSDDTAPAPVRPTI